MPPVARAPCCTCALLDVPLGLQVPLRWYGATDWLLEHQCRIDTAPAPRQLEEDTRVLCDASSGFDGNSPLGRSTVGDLGIRASKARSTSSGRRPGCEFNANTGLPTVG